MRAKKHTLVGDGGRGDDSFFRGCKGEGGKSWSMDMERGWLLGVGPRGGRWKGWIIRVTREGLIGFIQKKCIRTKGWGHRGKIAARRLNFSPSSRAGFQSM